jgi:hypothetical protein
MTTPDALVDAGVDPEIVTIWVTPGQESDYRATAPRGMRVEPGEATLHANRNFASSMTPERAEIVWCDDDVTGWVALSGSTTHPVRDVTSYWISFFEVAQKERVSLWSVAPTPNPFYMSPRTKLGLYYAYGAHYGVLNRPDLPVTLEAKEDYERTLLHYESDGGVLRFDFFSMHASDVGRTPGGLQDTLIDRETLAIAEVQSLMTRWPSLVQPNRRRGGHEVLLRRSAANL